MPEKPYKCDLYSIFQAFVVSWIWKFAFEDEVPLSTYVQAACLLETSNTTDGVFLQ